MAIEALEYAYAYRTGISFFDGDMFDGQVTRKAHIILTIRRNEQCYFDIVSADRWAFVIIQPL